MIKVARHTNIILDESIKYLFKKIDFPMKRPNQALNYSYDIVRYS